MSYCSSQVSSEDTLSSLAVRYNVGVGEIKRLNNLHSDSDLILKPTLRQDFFIRDKKNHSWS